MIRYRPAAAWDLAPAAILLAHPGSLVSVGGESVQGEELSHHEHPREDAERAGLPGELKRGAQQASRRFLSQPDRSRSLLVQAVKELSSSGLLLPPVRVGGGHRCAVRRRQRPAGSFQGQWALFSSFSRSVGFISALKEPSSLSPLPPRWAWCVTARQKCFRTRTARILIL